MWHIKDEKQRLEKNLLEGSLSFSGAYMALRSLHDIVLTDPEAIDEDSVLALREVLMAQTHAHQTQALSFYGEAAMTLQSVLIHTPHRKIFEHTFDSLKWIMAGNGRIQQQAASEALGALPLYIKSPDAFDRLDIKTIPTVAWMDFLVQYDIPEATRFEYKGRSLIIRHLSGKSLWVVKFTNNKEDVELLDKEAKWMTWIQTNKKCFPKQFHIPRPIKINGSYVFEPLNFPQRTSCNDSHENHCYAIAFQASTLYFAYPNSQNTEERMDVDMFYTTITANANYLGQMAHMGIIHTAPIPLFHNRTQAHRRDDRGFYEWPRAGRLDRWLFSCQYPNFAASGIRDFEHLEAFCGPAKRFYLYVGNHILSLILVMGSYFRNKAPSLVGLDESGNPVDVRDYFDEAVFQKWIEDAFKSYYQGFVSQPLKKELPFDSKKLVQCLIEEMGQDKYMEEILRIADQQAMTGKAFENFLLERGYGNDEIKNLSKDQDNITILSGPHLGAFNGGISVPDLIRCLSAASATCIADKYYGFRIKEFD